MENNSILRIKELLSEKKITGKELAELTGVTPASISNIVQGNSFPKPDLLISIADKLKVDVRELFYSTKETNKETIYVNREGSFVPIGEIKI